MPQPLLSTHILPRNKDSFVEDHALDAIEQRFLTAARILFAALVEPEPRRWAMACHAAAGLFPFGDPEEILRHVVHAIEAMRDLRRDVFVFSKHSCRTCSKVLSQEERLLVTTLQALRRQRPSEAYMNALLLCEGRDPARFLVALELFDYAVVSAERMVAEG